MNSEKYNRDQTHLVFRKMKKEIRIGEGAWKFNYSLALRFQAQIINTANGQKPAAINSGCTPKKGRTLQHPKEVKTTHLLLTDLFAS